MFRGRRGRLLYVAACALAAAVLIIGGLARRSGNGGAFGGFGVFAPPPAGGLSAAALGVNVAQWDYYYAADTSDGGGVNVMQPKLKSAGIGQIRYGGGSFADEYDWSSNTDIGSCPSPASFTDSCAGTDALGFAQFSRQARAIGAQSFVTVNFGSGTPAMAASWVAAAARTPAEKVALWEVGNEQYGCWEVDNELARPPANYQGYQPAANDADSNPSCPQNAQGDERGMHTLATSYAVNALRFLKAMKAADSGAQIGVPWALDTSVPDSNVWNDTVLATDAKYVSFVDAHYYPFTFTGGTGGSNPTDQQVLDSLRDIPAAYASMRATLNRYDPGAFVVIGETSVSDQETTAVCTPLGGLFAAGDVLSWLTAGARSVDWWQLNNYGNKTSACTQPDYGLFTSSSPPAVETPYYGYLLASVLAQPHARLAALRTSDPADVLAFSSALPDGKHAVALINTNTQSARTFTVKSSAAGLSGTLRTWRYGAAAPTVTTGTAPAASISRGITVPAESMIVLETR